MTSFTSHKTFRIFAWILGILLFLIMTTLTRVDRRDYQSMEYYQDTMALLDTLRPQISTGDVWFAGWSKQNTTPDTPASLMGYRPRGKYEFVLDSSYIRALVIGNEKTTVAFLNFELMLIHPHLYGEIHNTLSKQKIPVDFIYFTATHTHSGLGGYIPGVLGKVAFGGYDKNLVNVLVDNSIKAIQNSLATMDTVSVSFTYSEASEFVENRLIPNDPVDPFIRKLSVEKFNGSKAQIITYSAHPTILSSKYMGLSGDYPHYLVSALEVDDVNMALFAAGAVGSHRPIISGNNIEDVITYANNLAEKTHTESPKINLKPAQINFYSFPLHLRKPHFRISENIRLRPWLFNSLMGDTNAHFDVLQIGTLLFVNSSGEVSGVFMAEWEKYATDRGLQLIVNSFNGGYIGYITPDAYYDLPLYEARDMNWFGPQNGAFFDALVRKIIDKSEELLK